MKARTTRYNKLWRAVRRYTRAKINDSFKGGGTAPEIKEELKKARKALDSAIKAIDLTPRSPQ
jgi:hypothetical protein